MRKSLGILLLLTTLCTGGIAADTFQIAMARSFAPYVWTILARSARQNAAIRGSGPASD